PRTARQAASLSPPMFLIASTTFWASRRMPMAIRSEMAVALRSKRTLTTVPSRISRTMFVTDEVALLPGFPRRPGSLPRAADNVLTDVAGEQGLECPPYPAGVDPGEIGFGDQSLGPAGGG